MLNILVPKLLKPENLVVKSVYGKDVTCHELYQYFKSYMKTFQDGTMPEVKTLLEVSGNMLHGIRMSQLE